MTATLRRAGESDIAALVAIERASFSHPWPAAAFRHELTNDIGVLKVLTVNEEVVGYYDLWLCGGEGHLLNIAVAGGRRRRGYANILLRDACEEGRKGGCRTVLLEVRPDNRAALRLYTQNGFRIVGRERRYYADGADALVMAADL